jgi:hypothetical protein
MKMKALRILGYILFGVSMLFGAYLYIVSFYLWFSLIGYWGYLVSMFFVPDIVLIVIRIVQHGFLDWYVLYFVGDTILFWIGLMLMSAGKKD